MDWFCTADSHVFYPINEHGIFELRGQAIFIAYPLEIFAVETDFLQSMNTSIYCCVHFYCKSSMIKFNYCTGIVSYSCHGMSWHDTQHDMTINRQFQYMLNSVLRVTREQLTILLYLSVFLCDIFYFFYILWAFAVSAYSLNSHHIHKMLIGFAHFNLSGFRCAPHHHLVPS